MDLDSPRPRPRRSFPPRPTQATALVLRAHPYPDSFCYALAEAWQTGARAMGVKVETIDVTQLQFDPRLQVAHRGDQPLEPDLLRVKQALVEAAHVVVAFPMWWGSTPAALKGLFDRVLLPGWAFKYGETGLPVGGLAGRSARVLMTMDSPTWYERIVYRASARRQVRNATLKFCGLDPVKMSVFGSIGTSTPKKRRAMLKRAERDGVRDARKLVKRFGSASSAMPEAPLTQMDRLPEAPLGTGVSAGR